MFPAMVTEILLLLTLELRTHPDTAPINGTNCSALQVIEMKTLLPLCLLAACAKIIAFKIMERMIPRSNFVKGTKSNAATKHELVFAIVQRNSQELETLLMQRSIPGEEHYQQWLSYDEVHSLSCNPDGSQAVLDWLHAHDVEVSWQSTHQEYIKATATIGTWEDLLSTSFYEWTDHSMKTSLAHKDRVIHRSEQYSLPASVAAHLSGVFNTVQVPPEWKPAYSLRNQDDKQFVLERKDGQMVTPTLLKSLYKITPFEGKVSEKVQQAVFETSGESFSQSDLTRFQDKYGLPHQAALAPYGRDTTDCRTHSCYEGNLDVQYLMGLAPGVATIYWYTGTSDPFLTWITDVANSPTPPLVNSISWGSMEVASAVSSMHSFNNEARKLALQGVTIVVSSGDNGAATDASLCQKDSSTDTVLWAGRKWKGKGYFPSFPATSPYVTAVGGTMGPETFEPEIACQSQLGGVITTGGGFSTYYPMPSYQKDIVHAYLNSLSVDNQPTAGYNPHGRAYPDISLVSVWYDTIIQGQSVPIFGTSASAPAFGAMISLINAARAAQNKTSVGFVNPTLYAYGAKMNEKNVFNDVLSGHNKCMSDQNAAEVVCCESGFHATDGWDPVTGLGSVNFDQLSAMFESPVLYNYPSNNGRDIFVDLTDLTTLVLIALVGAVLTATLIGGIVYAVCFARKNSQSRVLQSGDVAMVEVSLHSGTPIDVEASDNTHTTAPRGGILASFTRAQPGNYTALAVNNPMTTETFAQPP